MEGLKTILTVGILPVAVAFITTKITYREETQKAILEKRAPLYLDVQRRAESLMYNSSQIFDIKFRKQRCTRGYKRYKETSGLIEWKERQIFHSIFT